MWLARKTSRQDQPSNVCSNDLNDINFNFDEKQSSPSRERTASKTEVNGEKMQKILTADVIARIRAVDCADSLMHDRSTPELQNIVGSVKQTIGQTGRHSVKTVEITKSSTEPLGFFIKLGNSLEKRRGIFVSRVSQGSVVDANGFLKVGDEILEVNRQDVGGFGVDDVVKMIQIPRHLILTIKETAFTRRRRASSETDLGRRKPGATENTHREQKVHAKDKHGNNNQSRANYYRRESGGHRQQTAGHVPTVSPKTSDSTPTDSNVTQGVSGCESTATKMNSTIEGLLSALHSQTENSHDVAARQPAGATESRATVQRRDKLEQVALSRKSPPNTSKSSTLVPTTTVNLIYEDHGQHRLKPKGDHKDKGLFSEGYVTTATGHSAPSPTSSPRAKRRLPTVPTDTFHDGSKPHLELPPDRAKRQLPTPPPSPPATEARREKLESRKAVDRRSWAGFEGGGDKDKALDLSRTEKESGLTSISQFISALTFHKGHSEVAEEKAKLERLKSPTNKPNRPIRKSESHYSDIVEQQQRLLNAAHVSSSSSSRARPRMFSRSSHPLMTLPIPEETKDSMSTNNPKFSPFSRRKSIATSTPDKSPGNEPDIPPESCHDKEPGFLVYPDDYLGENLKSSHAVSGMISMHLIKAENLLFADRKFLEKKKKVYCAVEVDSERKAVTSSKRASRTLVWYEVFEVDVQHGRKVALSCFTADKDCNKPIAAVSFTLAPFVRCGESHKVIFKMLPQGFVHIEMEFIEMKTLLKRTPSERMSGVFGFQLNVTSKLENSSVPLVVRKCVEEIDKRGLEVMGLYRISGNARRKRELRALFEEDSNAVELSEENYPDINVITGILKDYLRELPQPLIPPKMAEDLMKAAEDDVVEESTSIRKRALSKMLEPLRESNRETLIYLVSHLLRVVAHQDFNKMDSHNLSVCLGPVLLCPPSNLTESKDLLDLKRHVRVVKFLLDLWQKVDSTD